IQQNSPAACSAAGELLYTAKPDLKRRYTAMQCKKCGQNITNPRAKFCPVCGSPLEQTSSSGNSAPSPRTSAARPAKRRENWERYESPYAWVKWVVLAVAVVVLAVGAAVAMVLLNQQAGKENPRREDPS